MPSILRRFDEFRQDNHCWIKFMGIDWHIDRKDGHMLYVTDFGWREIIDISGLDIEAYTVRASKMIKEAYCDR